VLLIVMDCRNAASMFAQEIGIHRHLRLYPYLRKIVVAISFSYGLLPSG